MEFVYDPPPVAPVIRREMISYADRLIEAIVGYRTWRLTLDSGRANLRSVYVHELIWPRETALQKQCFCRTNKLDSPLHALPGACRETCGIHGWAEGVTPIDNKVTRGNWLRSEHMIHGEVWLWGKVKIHERGYKAEFAKPSCIYVYPGLSPIGEMRVKLAAYQYELPLVEARI